MKALDTLAHYVKEDPAKALRVASLISQGHSVAFAIRIIKISDQETQKESR